MKEVLLRDWILERRFDLRGVYRGGGGDSTALGGLEV